MAKENTWVHLEFESDAITNEDLKRFREYEAATSRAHRVNVITYVICSSNVKNLKSELIVGINVYRIKVIQLKERILKGLKLLHTANESITRLETKKRMTV